MKPKSQKSVAVIGGGIAGLTAASLLSRAGFEVTIIERAPDLRGGGFLVSLSEAAYRTAQTLGAMEELRPLVYRIERSSYHGPSGQRLLGLEYEKLFGALQVLQPSRDQLAQSLLSTLPDTVALRRGVAPQSVTQDAESVTVTLENGEALQVDALFAADGANSAVRDMVLGEDPSHSIPLGLCCAAFRLPDTLGLNRAFQTYMERDRYMATYSVSDTEAGAVFVWADTRDALPKTWPDRVALLKDAFKDAAPETQQSLAHVPENTPFYMDRLRQITLPRWNVGRVCFVGDAAHCLTLFSGRGAAAALVGAADAAQRLIETPNDPESAFAAYSDAMKPKLDAMQKATRDAVKWYVPRNSLIEMARNNAMRFLPNAVFEAYFRKKYSNV